MWKCVAATAVVGSLTFGLYRSWRHFTGVSCKCPGRLDGLVVVITGGNSGIGKALAAELARRGATLVLACRDVEKGIIAKADILSKLKNKGIKIFVRQLDLASIESIFRFSETLKSEFDEIYALVNNAGVFYHPHQITKDGFEITFQTNYLGHFALTHNLLELLRKSDDARIVNVSSQAHNLVDLDDLNAITKSQNGFRSHLVAYGASKLALILFTRFFSKALSDTNVIVNAADPGNVETDLFRYYPHLNNKLLYLLQWPLRIICVKRPSQGAQTLLHCLLTSKRSTGQYYSDCKPVLASPLASDETLAKFYYEITLAILGEKFPDESEC